MSRSLSERVRRLFDDTIPMNPRFCRLRNQRSNELQFFLQPVHASDITIRKEVERPLLRKLAQPPAVAENSVVPNFVNGSYYGPVVSNERQEVNQRIYDALNSQTDYHRVNLPLILKVLSEQDTENFQIPVSDELILNYRQQALERTRENDNEILRTPKYPWERPCINGFHCKGYEQFNDILMEYLTPDEMRAAMHDPTTLPEVPRMCLRCKRYTVMFMIFNIEANKMAVDASQFVVSEFYNITGKRGEYELYDCVVSDPAHIQCLPLPVVMDIPRHYKRRVETEIVELPGFAPFEIQVSHHDQKYDSPREDRSNQYFCATAETDATAKLGRDKNQKSVNSSASNTGGRNKKKHRRMHDALSRTHLFDRSQKSFEEEVELVERALGHPLEPWFAHVPFRLHIFLEFPEIVWKPFPLLDLKNHRIYVNVVNHINYIEMLIHELARSQNLVRIVRSWQDEFMPLILYIETCTLEELSDAKLAEVLDDFNPFRREFAFTENSLYDCTSHIVFCPITSEETHHPFCSEFDDAIIHLLFKAFPNAGKGRENASILFQMIGHIPRLLDFFVRIIMASQLGVYPTSIYCAPFAIRKRLYLWFMFDDLTVNSLHCWALTHGSATQFYLREYVFYMIQEVPALRDYLRSNYNWRALEDFMCHAMDRLHLNSDSDYTAEQLNKEMLAIAPRFNVSYFLKELNDEVEEFADDIPLDINALNALMGLNADVEIDVLYFLGLSRRSLAIIKQLSFIYGSEIKRSILSRLDHRLDNVRDMALLRSYMCYWRTRHALRVFDLPQHIHAMQVDAFKRLLDSDLTEPATQSPIDRVGTYYYCPNCMTMKARVLQSFEVDFSRVSKYTKHNSRCGVNFFFDYGKNVTVCKIPMFRDGAQIAKKKRAVSRVTGKRKKKKKKKTLSEVHLPDGVTIDVAEPSDCGGQPVIPINMLGKVIVLNSYSRPVALVLCPHCCNLTSLSFDSYIWNDGIFSCGCQTDMGKICATFCFYCSAAHEHRTPVITCSLLMDTPGRPYLADVYICDQCAKLNLRNFDRIYTSTELQFIAKHKMVKRYSERRERFYFMKVVWDK
jgi:hypothetical protein